MHPMRVLFLIPESNPPVLTGNYSKHFKEFVATCLKMNPKEVRLVLLLIRSSNGYLVLSSAQLHLDY